MWNNFPSNHNNQSWTMPKSRAQKSIQMSLLWVMGTQVLKPSPAASHGEG